MTSQSNPQLADVLTAFNAINATGTVSEFTSSNQYADLDQSHLQGFALYKDFYLVTQNCHDDTLGMIYIFHGNPLTQFAAMYLEVSQSTGSDPDRYYNHPGGIQVIGDFMLVPIQTQDYANTIVQLYDLERLTNSNPQFCLVSSDYLLDSNGRRIDGSFGGIGIVHLGSYFLLALCDNEKVSFFKSTTNDLTHTYYDHWFDATMEAEATEVSLLCDTSGNIYMVAFAVDNDGTSYADYAYLYQVNLSSQTITKSAKRHFDTNSSSFTILGPHFRWGAGIYFPTSTTLGLMTTQRVMQYTCKFDLWH